MSWYVIETNADLYGPFMDAGTAVAWAEREFMPLTSWVLRPLKSAAQNTMPDDEEGPGDEGDPVTSGPQARPVSDG